MDLFRHILLAAYNEIVVPQVRPGFLSSLFGKNPQERVVSESDRADIDIIRDARLHAVDVIRGGGVGNANFTGISTAKEYKIPLYWEEAPITAAMLTKRIPGVDPFTQTGRAAALAYHASQVMPKLALKINREIERMAAQALLTGLITLVNTESLDFHKKAAHGVTPAVKWDVGAGVPLADIQALCDTIFFAGKMKPDTLIFGSAAWTAFRANAEVVAYLDTKLIEPGRINPAEVPQGATLQGRIWIGDYQLDLFTYNEFYETALGVTVPYITTDSVIAMNRNARLDKVFGAVEILPHLEEQYRTMGLPSLPTLEVGDFHPFVYEKQPTALIAAVQSAPLVIPTAIDTMGTLDNVDT